MVKWRWIPLVLLFFFGGGVEASVYYYVDENGVRHYSDRPIFPESKRLRLWQNEQLEDASSSSADAYYLQIINEASHFYRVDPAMIRAMVRVESNFNPRAVSPKGAMGMMQLMPGTAAMLGVSDPFNPIENIWAGTYHVKRLILKYNYNYDLVFAAYNAGEGAVARFNGIPPYRETRNYVKKVHHHWKLYRNN